MNRGERELRPLKLSANFSYKLARALPLMVTNQLQVARKYSGDQESITIVSTNGFTRWGLNWCTQVSAICSPLAPALHNATSELHNAATALCNAMAILVSAATILVSILVNVATILVSIVTMLVVSVLHPNQQWPLLWLVVQRIVTLLYESSHRTVTSALNRHIM